MPENPTPQEKVIIAAEGERQAAQAAATTPGDFEAEGLARIAADQADIARAIAMMDRC